MYQQSWFPKGLANVMSFYKKDEKEDLVNSRPDLGGWEGCGADRSS